MIDQLAKEMLSNFQAQAETLKDVKAFSEKQFRSIAESSMRNLNLVTREEFDIQQAILERSREKIDGLEKQLAALEQKLAELDKT
jgi:BMFP domain-containing protein YqiC